MGERPDPEAAHSSAEFVALMRQLRRWADLSYRQLERNAVRAGQVLPRATVSGALNRDELPRENLLSAYVRACGCDEETVSAWLTVRRRLSISGERAEPPAAPAPAAPDAALSESGATDRTPPGTEPAGDDEHGEHTGPAPAGPGTGTPPRRRYKPLIATGLCAAAGVLALAFWPFGGSSTDALDGPRPTTPSTGAPAPTTAPPDTSSTPPTTGDAESPTASTPAGPAANAPAPAGPTATNRPPTADAPRTPAAGWTRIHPATDPALCLTEGRERNGRTDRPIAVQHACADAAVPRVYLEALGEDIYRIQWHHPEYDRGCLDVDEALTGPGALVSPRDCADADNQKFRLQPSHGGFRLRPVHSGLCIGFLSPATDGAEAVQSACTGTAGQAFRFTAT
ncbi:MULTISPECIES: RICIN domain-containing protein [unclassified Streptomyces]|uniref:RICIN domain-containing protein n=1 Tax=unclassified Streptomyces TaxID=2593676 RepID=UPI003661BE2A